MDEIDRIREERRRELTEEEEKSDDEESELTVDSSDEFKRVTTQDARQRIGNVKQVDEKKANRVVKWIKQRANGLSDDEVTEDVVKEVLGQISDDTGFNIRRR